MLMECIRNNQSGKTMFVIVHANDLKKCEELDDRYELYYMKDYEYFNEEEYVEILKSFDEIMVVVSENLLDKTSDVYSYGLKMMIKYQFKYQVYGEINTFYTSVGNLHYEYNYMDEAIQCYFKAISLTQDQAYESLLYRKICKCYEYLGKYQEAIKYYNYFIQFIHKSYEENPSLENQCKLGATYNEYARFFMNYKDYKQALNYYDFAISCFDEILEKDLFNHQIKYLRFVALYNSSRICGFINDRRNKRKYGKMAYEQGILIEDRYPNLKVLNRILAVYA